MRRLGFFTKKEPVTLSPSALNGVIVPLITPFTPDLAVDTLGLKTLTARLMNKGVRFFFALSAFSEYEFLSPTQRAQVLEVIAKEVGGKGMLIAGCFGNTTDEVIERIHQAQSYTPLCVVAPPAAALERELAFIDFFDSVFTQTSAHILLYNNPSLSGKSIPALWLDNIINWERLVGVIDDSRNPEYLDELGKYHQFTKLFEESEVLAFDALRRNFAGVCCPSTLLFPSYYLQLVGDFSALDFAKVMRMEAKVLALNKWLPSEKRIQAIKHVLALQGIVADIHAPHLESLSVKEKQVLETAFHLKHA